VSLTGWGRAWLAGPAGHLRYFMMRILDEKKTGKIERDCHNKKNVQSLHSVKVQIVFLLFGTGI
jgi:hypothetical protein